MKNIFEADLAGLSSIADKIHDGHLWQRRGQILAMQDAGMTTMEISKALGMPRSTVHHNAKQARPIFVTYSQRGERGRSDGARHMFDIYDMASASLRMLGVGRNNISRASK